MYGFKNEICPQCGEVITDKDWEGVIRRDGLCVPYSSEVMHRGEYPKEFFENWRHHDSGSLGYIMQKEVSNECNRPFWTEQQSHTILRIGMNLREGYNRDEVNPKYYKLFLKFVNNMEFLKKIKQTRRVCLKTEGMYGYKNSPMGSELVERSAAVCEFAEGLVQQIQRFRIRGEIKCHIAIPEIEYREGISITDGVHVRGDNQSIYRSPIRPSVFCTIHKEEYQLNKPCPKCDSERRRADKKGNELADLEMEWESFKLRYEFVKEKFDLDKVPEAHRKLLMKQFMKGNAPNSQMSMF